MEAGVVRNLFGKENKVSQTGTKPKDKDKDHIVVVNVSKTQNSHTWFIALRIFPTL